MARFTLRSGHEVRGFPFRIYPTREDVAKLRSIQDDRRTVWNWLIKLAEDTLDANRAYAVRSADKGGLGLDVGERPIKPDYAGMTPEESKAAKKAFTTACGEWGRKVYEATKGRPECAFRRLTGKPGTGSLVETYGCKYDYQLFQKVICWKYERKSEEAGEEVAPIVKPAAQTLQSLAKTYQQALTKTASKTKRRPKFRKAHEPMPLQTQSKVCFEMGDFGTRGATHRRAEGAPANLFYDCQIRFNGLRIRGRLPGRRPEGRILEGISIVEKADGWWASIKQELPIRTAPEPIPNTVVGIDVGLDNIAAISEVRVVTQPEEATFAAQGEAIDGSIPFIVPNIRDGRFSALIGTLQRQAQEARNARDFVTADQKQNHAARLHLAAEQHIKHQIHNLILKPLERVETIKIEELKARIGQMGGSKKTSVMRTIRTLLIERFGDKTTIVDQPVGEGNPLLQKNRVREVDPCYTSQDCSRCTKRSKESWSYEHGRVGSCGRCGYEADRDVNASRNVAAKPAEPLAA